MAAVEHDLVVMDEAAAMKVARTSLIDHALDDGDVFLEFLPDHVLDAYLRLCAYRGPHGPVMEVDVAIEAACQNPRPAWVALYLGPLRYFTEETGE